MCIIRHFYPRSPCGERHDQALYTVWETQISIHALLAESDNAGCNCRSGRPDFYPRSPCGERPTRHAQATSNQPISIHALLAESDRAPALSQSSAKYFYPRSPCGERPNPRRNQRQKKSISIHALLAESDGKSHKHATSKLVFLSTLSLRRATGCQRLCGHPTTNFYPRSPCGERRNADCNCRSGHPISIHALLAESDDAGCLRL